MRRDYAFCKGGAESKEWKGEDGEEGQVRDH